MALNIGYWATLITLYVGISANCPVDYAFKEDGGRWRIGENSIQAGMKGDIPVPFNYFNETQKRIAVFRPSSGTWLVLSILSFRCGFIAQF